MGTGARTWPTGVRALWQVAPALAWALLALGTVLPSGPLLDPRVSLCLVTALSAGGCWARTASPAQRAVWVWTALGLSGYAAGFAVLFWVSTGEAGGPWGLNWSDCASLLLYPAGYVGVVLLTRARVRAWTSAALLDGAIVGLAASAVAVAWAATAHPTLLDGSPLDVVYALAYPVGAATLLVATLTGLAMTRWRVDPVWALLVAGFGVMALGDALYGLASVSGTFRFGTPVDALYSAGPVLVCLASWRRTDEVLRREGSADVAMAVPAAATLAAVAVLVVGHDLPIPGASVWLAAAAVLLSVSRACVSWRQERQLAESRREAQVDELTGLPNRRHLLELLRRSLDRPGLDACVLLLDLDGFQEVKDTLGHAAGDRVLLELSDRLRSATDGAVARFGGTEFGVAVLGCEQDRLAQVEALRQALSDVVVVDGCRISVQVSLGLAVASPDAAGRRPDAAELVRRADVARHRAKALKTGVEAWTPSMDTGARDRLALLAELRGALAATDQIVVHYQPQVDPVTGVVLAREALVRWQHPRRGLLAPGAFLEAVEKYGLLPELTARVLDLVLAEQAGLAATGTCYCGQVWGSLAKGEGQLSRGTVHDVRAGRHACFDRLVLDVDAPLTAWSVRYVDQVTQDGSGRAVPVRGGARLEVVAGVRVVRDDPFTFAGSGDLVDTSGYRTFRHVAWVGSFEGVTTIGLGVRARLPFRAFVLAGPGDGSRLVVDVGHRW